MRTAVRRHSPMRPQMPFSLPCVSISIHSHSKSSGSQQSQTRIPHEQIICSENCPNILPCGHRCDGGCPEQHQCRCRCPQARAALAGRKQEASEERHRAFVQRYHDFASGGAGEHDNALLENPVPPRRPHAANTRQTVPRSRAREYDSFTVATREMARMHRQVLGLETEEDRLQATGAGREKRPGEEKKR